MEHLKELRSRKKLIQKDVAEALKIDRTTYAKYETGDSEPSFEILKRIATFYDVSTDYLIGYKKQEKSKAKKEQEALTDEEKNLIDQYRSLNDQGQQMIRQVMLTAVSANISKRSANTSDLEEQIG